MKKYLVLITLFVTLIFAPAQGADLLPAAKELIAVLKKEKIEYKLESNDKANEIIIVLGGDNASLFKASIAFFKNTPDSATIGAYDFVSIGSKKDTSKIFTAINSLNKEYLYFKFLYDEKTNMIDIVGSLKFYKNSKGVYEDRGRICYDMLNELYFVCDDSYPTLMRTIWN